MDDENKKFVAFMFKRFPKEESKAYIYEWAERFRYKSAHAHADRESKTILISLGILEGRDAHGDIVDNWHGEAD